MKENDLRQTLYNPCTLGAQTGPQTIIVRQVVGEQEKQKVLDIHVTVPDPKPAVEQIIDVFVKELEINCVDVITDKVVVRGEFEIKAIYVADTDDHAVHAVEIRHYRWTLDIDMPGARRGMDADASVIVEFVDYDMDDDWHHHHHRDLRSKYYDPDDDDDDCDDDHHHHDDHCDDHCDDDCGDHHHHHNCREFDVSVVLKVVAKVLADREVMINNTGLPTNPKG